MGGYDDLGIYQSNIPVSLVVPSEKFCQPCLSYYDERKDGYFFINQPFKLSSFPANTDTVFLGEGERLDLEYSLKMVKM